MGIILRIRSRIRTHRVWFPGVPSSVGAIWFAVWIWVYGPTPAIPFYQTTHRGRLRIVFPGVWMFPRRFRPRPDRQERRDDCRYVFCVFHRFVLRLPFPIIWQRAFPQRRNFRRLNYCRRRCKYNSEISVRLNSFDSRQYILLAHILGPRIRRVL